MNVNQDTLVINNVINRPEPFLKILWDFIKVYDHNRVNKKPMYLNIMSQYCICGKVERQI